MSKRKVWDVIENLKKDKIVVLTTHSMEEADSLADHISIMHSGRLKASGTPMFLKNHYGNGYNVSLLQKSGSCTEALEKWVTQVLPGSQVVSSAAGAVTIGVGRGSGERLAAFLRVLQSERDLEWSISNSTLEEVFLKLCTLNEGVNTEVAKDTMCRVCFIKKTEPVTLFTRAGVKILVSGIII